MRLGRNHALLNLHLALVYAFLYGPILVLVALSFNRAGLPTAWTGFSLRWYEALAGNESIRQAVVNTLIVATVSTLIATAIGTLLAIGVERGRSGPVLDAALFAPMIIPDIVLAIALLSFYSMVKLSLGLHSIVLSHVVFNIAFVAAVVRTRLKHFDWSVVEVSADLGASALTTFRLVTLPIIFPGVLAAALLAFTLSVDEFIIAYFTSGAGPSSTTFPIRIYSMIRFGVTPEINAVATIVMGVSFTLVLASQRLLGERRRS
ncbi:MAG TPA: ABC transporter permease [Alphaproteobacteria bacterium]|nr:ABC transporter permease [Alphaproteobacteria bacterium]